MLGIFRSLILAAFATLPQVSSADSFTSCPSEAFLVQAKPAKLYGVDLSTGSYELLSDDMGTNGKLNAMSFSFHDQFFSPGAITMMPL